MHRIQVRRATVDDLPQLRPLWEAAGLPVEALEKRFVDFQVAHADQGEIVAAIALSTDEAQGCLHSEVIAWLDEAGALRGQMWPRLEALARSQNLFRLWIDSEEPFWKGLGFKKAAQEMLTQRPAAFGEGGASSLYLPLRAAEGAEREIEKQIAVLRAMSQSETEQLMERAQFMKWIAMGLITLVFAAFAVWVVYYTRLRSRLRRQRGGR
jgi:N-acetylglutamate synthase-like GNAT family acetyltransferase